MRPAVRMARRSTMKPANAGEELPATEDLPISVVNTLSTGNVVGASFDAAGALAVLTDGSDVTYLDDNEQFATTVNVEFADPVQASGRDIASAVFVFRYQDANEGGLTAINIEITPAPAGPDPIFEYLAGGAPTTVVTSAMSPTGGGTWTLAQWNALSCDLTLYPYSGTGRMIGAFARVTYAI